MMAEIKPNNSLSLIPPQVLRNLGDRSYEKRKSAALAIEMLVKELTQQKASDNNNNDDTNSGGGGSNDDTSEDKVRKIIESLVHNYAYSTQANHRKGGLIGLAAAAIALMDNTMNYLQLLVPPVLKCFQDPEARVRYYACEAMYNMSKVVRGAVLVYFNAIFDGLCKLYSDPNSDVKNGAQLLDRLLKDVVTESENFDVSKFIPLLKERIQIKDPSIRQLLVGWITVLDSVPDIEMLEYLPEYLEGLFEMLSDKRRDIRQQANSALDEFLREITQSVTVELGPMIKILVKQCQSSDNFTRLSGLTWMCEFLQLGKVKLLSFSADMLGACLHCISDSEEEIREKAQETNGILLKLVESKEGEVTIAPLLVRLTTQVRNKWVATRLAALRWISMLLQKMPTKILEHLNELFPALMQTLSDPDDHVVRLDLEVLALISLNPKYFDMVLNSVINLFAEDRKLLESRGSVIIRQLSVLLDGESIYRAMGRILDQHHDLEFTSLMVQTLNLILLTSAELFELRSRLKNSLYTNEGCKLFTDLYKSWCHNAVATFSLCLLAQAYELASELVFQIADIEVTVGLLMQVDKLVQLIESPIFVHLRLHLLEPERHPFLVKSLYGLLMLLPQSLAFKSLQTRLGCVVPLNSLRVPQSKFSSSTSNSKSSSSSLNYKQLLEQFKGVQERHSSLRKEVFQQHQLATKLKFHSKNEAKQQA